MRRSEGRLEDHEAKLSTATDRVRELEAKPAQDAVDAERYRWLRAASVDVPGVRVVVDESVRFLERLDAAIDAAINAKEQP